MGEAMFNRKMKKKKARLKRQKYQKKSQKPVAEMLVTKEGAKAVVEESGDTKSENDSRDTVVAEVLPEEPVEFDTKETAVEFDTEKATAEAEDEDVRPEVIEEVEVAKERQDEAEQSKGDGSETGRLRVDESETKRLKEDWNGVKQSKEVLPRKNVLDIEVDGSVGERRRGKSWIWWVIFVAGMLLAAGGICLAFMDKNEGAEVGVEDNKTQDQAEENPEVQEVVTGEGVVEKEPAEGEEEEKPTEEVKPQEQPVQPIQPRPERPVELPEVKPGSRLIALTFDDGPSASTTPRLLDILQQRDVKATFFVLGTMAQRAPEILKREAAEGHEVASHTPYHNQLTRLSYAQVRAEAAEMDRIFTEILGTVPPFTRPPYGSQNATVGQALGQPMILWSIDPRDWQDRNAGVVCSRVTSAARDGAIILVHDIHASTVDAVPCIVDNLRAQGYEFLTVSELAAARGVSLADGVAYYSF